MIRQGDLLLVERLDDLKQRSRMISMTLAGAAIEPQLPEGRIVDCLQEGRRLRWFVTDMPDVRIGEINKQQGVESVDVHRPNLEEIFVAHMQGTVERSEANDLASCPKADPSAGVEEVV